MLPLNDPLLLKSTCLVAGEWRSALSGETLEVCNPATGELITSVPKMGAEETRSAINAAQEAFQTWRETTAEERAKILRRWYELMQHNAQDLAQLMTLEQGKPLTESLGEIAYAASYIEWYSEEARRAYGTTIPSPWQNKRLVLTKEPVGVCAAITPWNFPAAMITRKVAPALAAGCTIIVKPAQQTPLSALALAELAQRAGVPSGVFSVLTGGSQAIGGMLTASPLVRKLTFTGSTEVGRVLAAQCAPTLKKMSLELGGNAPFIVFEDADLDAAVDGVMASKFRNSGQTCVCTNRILVHSSVHDAFVAKLTEAVQLLKVGNGMHAGVTQGPLIDESSLSKVQELVDDALMHGAQLIAGGARHALGGTFYQPTLITDVTPAMRIAREEVFGPVAPVFRFDTEDEALAMANDTEFGLAAYFYSRDVGRSWRLSSRLQYGMVGINSGIISTAVAPFGGVKQSGMGREGSFQGMEEYLDTRYLCVGL